MIVCQPIRGISIGLEYVEREDLGFIVNADLGLLRVTWYKDVHVVDNDEEDPEL